MSQTVAQPTHQLQARIFIRLAAINLFLHVDSANIKQIIEMANRNLNNLSADFRRKLDKLTREVSHGILIVIGKEAVDQFRDNFHREGFLNGGLHKWKDVKRRDPQSPWYGFEYKAEKRLPGSRKKPGKKAPRLNFSQTATVRKILASKRMELYNSLRYYLQPGQVIIASDKPYAQVQNEGGTIKIFGKHPVKLEARPFMGHSVELDRKVEQQIRNRITEILKP